MRASEDAGTRGLGLALWGLLLIPGVLLVLAIVPAWARVAGFLVGLALIVAIAGRGGWLARNDFVGGARHPVRAFLGAAIGLALAATAAMVLLWSAIGIAIS